MKELFCFGIWNNGMQMNRDQNKKWYMPMIFARRVSQSQAQSSQSFVKIMRFLYASICKIAYASVSVKLCVFICETLRELFLLLSGFLKNKSTFHNILIHL